MKYVFHIRWLTEYNHDPIPAINKEKGRRRVCHIQWGGFLWIKQAGDVDVGGLAHIVGKPSGFAAAGTWRTLPLMPPPADLECVAQLLLKIAQSQTRPDAPRRVEGTKKKKKKEKEEKEMHWGGCQLTDCQKWWCEKRTMSQSVFCYVSVQWREKTGEARELMKWLHSGSEGKGGVV